MTSLKDNIRTLLAINSKKIRFLFIFSSITFSIAVTILLLIIHSGSIAPFDISLAIILIFSAALALPLFIILLASCTWLYELHLYDKAFRIYPFSEMSTIGFKTVRIMERSRWNLTKKIKAALIDDFQFHCYIEKEEKEKITFWTDALGKESLFKAMRINEKMLKHNSFEYHRGGYSKRYSLSSPPPSPEQVLHDLQKLCQLLRSEEYDPVHYTDISKQL